MFEDGKGDFVELINQVHCSIDVKQVVVRNFLAVNLVKHGIQVAKEKAALMGILSITQLLGIIHCTAESREVISVKITKDGRIIVRRNGKSLFCEPTAFFKLRARAALRQDVTQRLVLGLAGHDDHVAVVFRTRTNQRDAAYVNFLDNGLLAGTRSHCLFKGIEIHNHQINFRNSILSHLAPVAFFFTACKDSSENFRMEGLHTSAQNGWITSQVFHSPARKT